MGTLIYLSPEQLSGKQLDLRSDIFSLGAVLYEMITGHRAFPQKVLSELVQKKTKGEYKPILTHGINAPEKLIAIVDKAMALEPADRYANCADFSQDLFAVFRNISDRAPQDIIARFLTNPSSVMEIRPVVLTENRKRNDESVNLIKIAGIGALVFVALLIIIKMFLG
jgi:serine/threonine protein kinase